MDEVITFSANLAARGCNVLLWSQAAVLEVGAQCLVEHFNDLALVVGLAPVEKDASGPCPPDHVFEPGNFSLSQRLGCWAAKWRLYTCIGFCTGLFSICVTGMLSREATLLSLPSLSRAAFVGAVHLGVSANTRYQLVNGAEVLLYRALPLLHARAGSVAIRFLNNWAGGFSWIALATVARNSWPLV